MGTPSSFHDTGDPGGSGGGGGGAAPSALPAGDLIKAYRIKVNPTMVGFTTHRFKVVMTPAVDVTGEIRLLAMSCRQEVKGD